MIFLIPNNYWRNRTCTDKSVFSHCHEADSVYIIQHRTFNDELLLRGSDEEGGLEAVHHSGDVDRGAGNVLQVNAGANDAGEDFFQFVKGGGAVVIGSDGEFDCRGHIVFNYSSDLSFFPSWVFFLITLCLIFTTAKFSSISVSVECVLRLCPTTSANISPVR